MLQIKWKIWNNVFSVNAPLVYIGPRLFLRGCNLSAAFAIVSIETFIVHFLSDKTKKGMANWRYKFCF